MGENLPERLLYLTTANNQEYSAAKELDNKLNRTKSFNAGYQFYFNTIQYNEDNFHEVIQQFITAEKYQNSFICLGGLTQHGQKLQKTKQLGHRRKKEKGGIKPTIQDREGIELVLDCDDHIIEGFDANNPVQAVKDYLAKLDANLADTDFTFQITSSQKLDTDEARIRIYLLSAEPSTLNYRKAWSQRLNFDGCVYTCSQPIYTANPKIIEGDDPIVKRHYFVKGNQRTYQIPEFTNKQVVKYSDNSYLVPSYNFEKKTLPREVRSGKVYRRYFMPKAFSILNKISPLVLQDAEMAERMVVGEIEREASVIKNREFNRDNVIDYVRDGIEIIYEEHSKEVDEITLPEDAIQKVKYEIDWPPGLMGEVCQQINKNFFYYPNKIMAISAGLAAFAGIMGRVYQVDGLGLNMYITLLAKSGMGKDGIDEAVKHIVMANEPLDAEKNFLGSPEFFSERAIFNMFSKKGMSKVCISDEAGMKSGSTAGDTLRVQSTLLTLFGRSTRGKTAEATQLSNASDNCPMLHSPSLTVLHLSVPKSYLKNLKEGNSHETGRLARVWLLRAPDEYPYENENRTREFDNIIYKRILEIKNICRGVKEAGLLNSPMYKTFNIKLPDWLKEQKPQRLWRDRQKKYAEMGDDLRENLCSRAWSKILKMSAICSVVNGKTEIGEGEYKWATKCIERELKFVQHTFYNESTDTLEGLAKNVMYVTISNVLRGKSKDAKVKAREQLHKKNMISKSTIVYLTKNNNLLNSLDDDPKFKSNPINGNQKVLDYMVKMNYLRRISEDVVKRNLGVTGRGYGEVYQITEEFKLLADFEYEEV